MFKIIFSLAIIVIVLALLYRSGKKKDGFVRHSSRGAYMRDLNKEIGRKQ
jgi:hypothetical protein